VVRYANEEEALIGLARHLADAYAEAATDEDAEYAADQIDDFLSDYDDHAPDEALIELLALPASARTWPLLDSVQETLAERGPQAVQALLVAARRGPAGAPRRRRALETLGLMPESRLAERLALLLGARIGDDVKTVAVHALVAIGDAAVPRLEEALYDPDARPWAEEALGDLRARHSEDDRLAAELGAEAASAVAADRESDDDLPFAERFERALRD
jgi:hypothetical protein